MKKPRHIIGRTTRLVLTLFFSLVSTFMLIAGVWRIPYSLMTEDLEVSSAVILIIMNFLLMFFWHAIGFPGKISDLYVNLLSYKYYNSITGEYSNELTEEFCKKTCQKKK